MISGTRNMLQASVDENCEVMSRLITSVPDLLRRFFEEEENQAKEQALHDCGFDRDVYNTIFNSLTERLRLDQEEWMISEFYRSMVLLIYSFAETTIKNLLNNPKVRFKDNYLFNAYTTLNREKALRLDKIGRYWNRHNTFARKRNDIAHNRREVHVTSGELYDALDGVHTLLRAIADAMEKKRIHGEEHNKSAECKQNNS